jgi:DNA-binding GntR family transcriptional regulator
MIPYSGIYVTQMGLQELRDIIEVRNHLLELEGKLAAERITEEQLVEMEKLLKKVEREKSPEKLMKLDSEFHRLIDRATHNQMLCKILEALGVQIARMWVLPRDKSFVFNFSEDFKRLLAALKAKDGRKSAQILQMHMQRFVEEIRRQL